MNRIGGRGGEGSGGRPGSVTLDQRSADLRPTISVSASAFWRDEIIRLREAGIGPREVARRLGLSPNIVAGVLRRGGKTTAAPTKGWAVACTPEFRAIVVAAMETETTSVVAARWGLHWCTPYKWRQQAIAKAGA